MHYATVSASSPLHLHSICNFDQQIIKMLYSFCPQLVAGGQKDNLHSIWMQVHANTIHTCMINCTHLVARRATRRGGRRGRSAGNRGRGHWHFCAFQLPFVVHCANIWLTFHTFLESEGAEQSQMPRRHLVSPTVNVDVYASCWLAN